MSDGLAKSFEQSEHASTVQPAAHDKAGSLDLVAVLARWFVGGVFVYMGLVKALSPAEFLELVHQYGMTNTPLLLNAIAAALPWFEVFCGLLMFTGVGVRGTALVLLLMLAPFTGLVLRRALGISAADAIPLCAVNFDCGCGTGVTGICPKLVENCLLMFLSAWLMSGRGRQFCLRFSLLGNCLPAV